MSTRITQGRVEAYVVAGIISAFFVPLSLFIFIDLKNQPPGAGVIGIGALGLEILAMYAIFSSVRRREWLKAHGQMTNGTVTSTSLGGAVVGAYDIRFTYQDSEGRTHKGFASLSRNHKNERFWKVGALVPIQYDPGKPREYVVGKVD